MQKEVFFFILFLLGVTHSIAQSPSSNPSSEYSSYIKGRLGLMGTWQTGNLDQLSVLPNGGISIVKNAYFAEFNASYHYLNVRGFNAINDFWTYGLFQHQPNHRVFPSIHTIMGFARSYKIEHSIVTGAGGGINVKKKSPDNFLQLHLYGSYLNFQYEMEGTHKAVAIGSLIRAMLPIKTHISLRWELSTFHSLWETNFWGGSNLLQLNISVLRNLSMNLSHQSYYNHQTAMDIENTNTEMLFGIQYQLNYQ